MYTKVINIYYFRVMLPFHTTVAKFKIIKVHYLCEGKINPRALNNFTYTSISRFFFLHNLTILCTIAPSKRNALKKS